MAEVIAALTEPPNHDPNDPCKSNDVDNWTLTQAMFGRTTTNDETGEEEDDDGNFLLNPCFVDEENVSESPTTVEPSSQPTRRPSPPPSLPPSAMPTRRPSPPPSTAAPTTESPTTAAPSRKPTRRPSPSPSLSPSTRPSSSPPTTLPPSTPPPTTESPITVAPITPSPTSAAPSKEPSTESPTIAPFYTKSPTSAAPSLKPTKSPSTEPPTTAAPTTESPTTAAPSREPTTASPSREPSTQLPTLSPSGELIVTTTTTSTTTEATTTTTEAPGTTSTTARAETTTTSTEEFVMVDFTTQETESTTSATQEASPSDEVPRSFYSCSPSDNGNGSSSSSNNDSPAVLPPATTELTVTYDYELHTSSPFNADTLSKFENSIAQDLAGRYGLINCGVEPTRMRRQRYLRSLRKQGEVVALDSEPVDESLADSYECEVPVVNLDASSTSCTPIRGYMTAHLPNSSSADDTAETEAQLLALIQNGMRSDSYASDDVVKASYVGVREDNGSSQDDGQSSGNNAAGDNDNANGVADPATGNPNLDGAKGTDTGKVDSSTTTPLLAIGISIFLLAFSLAIALAVFLRKKRRRSHFYSDGPNANNDIMGNNNVGSIHRPNSLAARAAMAEPPPRDPDDVHLLSSPDKFDMRSVYSEDASTDVETENYAYDDYNNDQGEEKSRDLKHGVGRAGVLRTTLSCLTVDHGNLAEGSNDNNGDTPKSGNSRTSRASAGSALAAMGVASTLVTRSYTPTPTSATGPNSSPATSVDSPTQDTPGGASSGVYSESNSHVGTVEEEEGSVSVASMSVSTPNEEKEGMLGQKLSSDSSSMSSTEGGGGAFRLDEPMANWS